MPSDTNIQIKDSKPKATEMSKGPPPSYDSVTTQNGDIEKQPLQIKDLKAEEICLKVDPNTELEETDKDQSARASLILPSADTDNEQGDALVSYAIDPLFQNTADNPYRETTVTVPHLVRKVPSMELVPKGWKSTKRVLIGSYFAILFCCFIGVFANRYAWRAKRYRSKGLYTLVARDARRAVILTYVSIAVGLCYAIGLTLGFTLS